MPSYILSLSSFLSCVFVVANVIIAAAAASALCKQSKRTMMNMQSESGWLDGWLAEACFEAAQDISSNLLLIIQSAIVNISREIIIIY